MEQRTANSIALGTKLGLFWGVTTTITITSLHEGLQVCDRHFPSQHRLVFEDMVNPVIMMITVVVSQECHARSLSRGPRTSFLKAVTYVVSQGDHVRRLSRQSPMLSLEAITYVIS